MSHGGQVIIGDYCSIGHNVQFIIANHDLELITTYPFKSLEVFYTDESLQMTDDHILKVQLELVMMFGLETMLKSWLG